MGNHDDLTPSGAAILVGPES